MPKRNPKTGRFVKSGSKSPSAKRRTKKRTKRRGSAIGRHSKLRK